MKQLQLVPGADLFRCVFYNPRMKHVRGFNFSVQRLTNGRSNCDKANLYAEKQCELNNNLLLTVNFHPKGKHMRA